MRIDAHQHFWVYSAAEYAWMGPDMGALRRDFLPHHLEPLLRDLDVGYAVAVQARQTIGETEWLLSLAEAHHWVVGVVGWVDLCRDGVESATVAKYSARQRPALWACTGSPCGHPYGQGSGGGRFLGGASPFERAALAGESLGVDSGQRGSRECLPPSAQCAGDRCQAYRVSVRAGWGRDATSCRIGLGIPSRARRPAHKASRWPVHCGGPRPHLAGGGTGAHPP